MAGPVLEAYWLPSPGIAARQLDQAALNAADLWIPAEEAQTIMSEGIQRTFDTESDPWGSPWAEWSESYRDTHPSGHGPKGDSILRRDGDLEAFATSDAPWTVDAGPSEATVTFDPSGGPEYGEFHLTGTYKMPARVWIGLSPEDEAKLIEMFSAWGDSIIPGFTSTHSTGQVTRRDVLGRFA